MDGKRIDSRPSLDMLPAFVWLVRVVFTFVDEAPIKILADHDEFGGFVHLGWPGVKI
jgi:hypothetical protein